MSRKYRGLLLGIALVVLWVSLWVLVWAYWPLPQNSQSVPLPPVRLPTPTAWLLFWGGWV